MGILTKLELAVLEDWISAHPEDAALQEQLVSAKVISRENSGVGYFTNIAANRSAPPVKSIGPRSAAWVEIKGFEHPTGHVIWTAEGYIDCLEGFTIEDSSVDLNWADVEFTVLQDPNSSA